ncbi:MAG: SDR family NAD(P)-dependent oxidoreductase [Alphaproteobacteria bacterium]
MSAHRLDGKVAFITGSGGGMGRAEAVLMAERGADIIVHDVKEKGANETAEQVRAKGRKAHVIVADVTDIKTMTAEIAKADKAMGKIDILVNNAGIGGDYRLLDQLDEAAFDKMFNTHVKASFFCAKAVVPGMKERKKGKIINISSNWAMIGAIFSSHYCGAKAAILGLTKAWAKELAPYNINVNAVAPGWVDTGMGTEEEKKKSLPLIPLKRMGQPIEPAYAVAFLASSESDFITGQVICPNGGDGIVGI